MIKIRVFVQIVKPKKRVILTFIRIKPIETCFIRIFLNCATTFKISSSSSRIAYVFYAKCIAKTIRFISYEFRR